MYVDEETLNSPSKNLMLFEHEDFKTKVKPHIFHIYILCFPNCGWDMNVFGDGYLSPLDLLGK